MAEKYTTEILHHMNEEQLPLNAISPPIFQTSIFQHSSYDALVAAFADEEKSLLYTRGNNPTVNLVEQKIAALEHGEKAKLVASGVAAISQAILAFVQSGDHIIAVEDCYPPTRHLIEIYLKRFEVSSSFVEGTKLEDFENALQSNTRLILLESPTTVTFKLQNLKEVAAFAQQHKIKTIIDNSWATPIFQNPIKFGIDLVVHSASKYLGGNSDIVGGVIIGNKEDLRHIFKNEFLITGPVPDPFQAWLILRNMRTLHIKMPVHFQNTLAITEYLSTHDKVENIIYPFRPDFPQHNLAQEQMRGGGRIVFFSA